MLWEGAIMQQKLDWLLAEWPTKALVLLQVRLRFCDTGRGGMLHKYHTYLQEHLLQTRLEVEQ